MSQIPQSDPPFDPAAASYDVADVRAMFPALAEGAAHFDGPGGSQVALPVAQAIYHTLTSAIANRGSTTRAERRAESIVVAFRLAMGDLLEADPRGIVFGRSMTQLTYDLSRTLGATWRPGDEVVVTRLDHDANVRPWVQAAAAAGATVRWADFDPRTGELTPDDLSAALSERTRLVAFTAASNLIGTRPDVGALTRLARAAGAIVFVDAVHLAAHATVSQRSWGADVVACSPYKFLGPHCGVLAARPELLESLHPDKLLPSSDAVPERFELGTLPYELLAGCTAAVDVLAGLLPSATGSRRDQLVASFRALEAHENRLRSRIEAGLAERDDVTLYSRAAHRTPTLLFRLAGRSPAEVRAHLATRSVNAPAGSFYALETSQRLGLGAEGGVRVGLAPYDDDHDVDRLLAALEALGTRRF